MEESSPLQQSVYRGEESAADVGFGNEAVSPGGFGSTDHFFAIVHGEHENRDSGQLASDLASGGKTVEDRHGDIENDEIGAQFYDFLNRVGAIGRFATNVETLMGLK